MFAVTQNEPGGPDVLTFSRVARPEPGIGEILIRVRAAGINPADHMNRRTAVFSGPPPFILGWDVSGDVAATGPGVTIHQPGGEVFGLLPFPRGAGAYAEYVVGPARAFVPKPAQLSHPEAAALPLAGLTAWQSLVDTAGLTQGQRVLITGSTGGVGHLALQIAAQRGAHVIAVASTGNVERARALGAHEVIDYRSADFAAEVRDVDVVLEAIGGDYPARALTTLRHGGTLVSTLPQSLVGLAPSAQARGVRLAGLFVEADRMGMLALSHLVDSGALRPTIAAQYPLADAARAHATEHGPGKVVLVVD